MDWSLEYVFKGLGAWSARPGLNRNPVLWTGLSGPTASAYVDSYEIAEFRPGVYQREQVPVGDLGLDQNTVDAGETGWAQVFARANLLAANRGYFYGIPDFTRTESPTGPLTRITWIRQVSGVSWQDVPASEVLGEPLPFPFPFPPLATHRGKQWLLSTHRWARAHGFATGLPTGWSANYGSGYVMGVVLFTNEAVRMQDALGNEFLPAEACAFETQPSLPRPPDTGGNIFTGTAEPATLAIDEAPFGTRLFAEANDVDYLRCVTQREGEAAVALLDGNHPHAVSMLLTPRQDNRTLVYFGNESSYGTWIVAHRLNAARTQTIGEVASSWRAPGASTETLAFELTPGPAGPGQLTADTVGFVRQGTFGIAFPVMSFAWSTWLRISPGMDVHCLWVP